MQTPSRSYLSFRTLSLGAVVLTLFVTGLTAADEPKQASDAPRDNSATATTSSTPPAAVHPSQAVEKAIAFLLTDAAKWRQEKVCSTCHHGTMTVWALGAAKNQGYRVNAETLADMIEWTKGRFMPVIGKPRDSRPGWSLVSVPGIYLGMMSHDLPILSRDEVNRIAMHLARHQEEDGVWLMPPPTNGAPPTWESRETLARLALLAWEPYVPADPAEAAAARASREKALAWLAANKSSESTQATALRLVMDIRSGKTSEQFQASVDQLFARQNPDGGWSQVPSIPSDAYATGQTLWALGYAGISNTRSEIGRAISFLVANQREDGAWPMKSRDHPEVTSARTRNPVPITYFGSAWATIGLVRFVPKPPDADTLQKLAIDKIREYHGKFDVEESSPEKPVVRVDLRYYDVDDLVLGDFAKVLQGCPKLVSLELKSPKITDAGLTHLKQLPHLRTLTLENSAITDAGLLQLSELTYLENLNLKGTKVTDAGVKELQQKLPNTKVDRGTE